MNWVATKNGLSVREGKVSLRQYIVGWLFVFLIPATSTSVGNVKIKIKSNKVEHCSNDKLSAPETNTQPHTRAYTDVYHGLL